MSPPSRGAWIEIRGDFCVLGGYSSSPPSRGAWIEICILIDEVSLIWESPPSRGAWIEMAYYVGRTCFGVVAPLAGGVD